MRRLRGLLASQLHNTQKRGNISTRKKQLYQTGSSNRFMCGKDSKQNLILHVTHPKLVRKTGLIQPNWADWGEKIGQS